MHPTVSELAVATNCHQTDRMVDWQRLGQLVIARRIELGYKTREALLTDLGVSLRTLGDIESGRRDKYHRNTLAGLEHALRWLPGSIDAILDGGQPTPDPNPRHSGRPAGENAHAADSATATRPTSTGNARSHPPVGDASDDALIRVMRSDLDDRTKAKIVKMLIAEQERFARERAARAEELIQAFRDDG